MIGLSTSTFYYKPKLCREAKEKADAELRDLVEMVQSVHPRSGYRTMREYLLRDGVKVGERRLRRVMRENGLNAKIKRAFLHTTDSNHSHRVYPNLLIGKTITGLNQVWASDFTYIRIVNGFVFLAVILDLFSRKVIGWAISRNIDTDLALNALKMATQQRKPKPGCIHHSDRGAQYLCRRYVDLLKKHGFEISNSAKGNPYHNAFVESFMKTLKQEEVYLGNYQTYLDVIENVPRFIEDIYNEKRIHSGIEYLTPNELEKKIELESIDASRFALNL